MTRRTKAYKPDTELSTQGLAQRYARDAKKFEDITAGYVAWSKLPAGAKHGTRIKWSLPKHQSPEIWRRNGNNMVVPIKNLVGFDLDINADDFKHFDDPAREMREVLAGVLEVDSRELLTVRTPSGGMHIYTLWGDENSIPPKSENSLQRLDDRLKGDIRSSPVNGYLVGPGSWIASDDQKIKEHMDASMERSGYIPWRGFNSTRAYYYVEQYAGLHVVGEALSKKLFEKLQGTEKPIKTKKNKAEAKKEHGENTPVYIENRGGHELYTVIERIEESGELDGIERFYLKRAWVNKAISCHYSSAEVLDAWNKLGLAVDSNGGTPRAMEHAELMKDIGRLNDSIECSGYCRLGYKGKSSKSRERAEYIDDEELIKEAQQKASSFQTYRTYYAVNILKAADFIMRAGKRKTPSKGQILAFQIVINQLSFHAGLGRKSIKLGLDFLTEHYGVTRALAKRALSILRNAGIIKIKKKQAPGWLPIYVVGERFIEQGISHVIRGLISKNMEGRDGIWSVHEAGVEWTSGIVYVVDINTGVEREEVSKKLEKMSRILEEKHPYFYSMVGL